jgi:hypothetical protein
MKTKQFLKENWYKLTLSASAIIFSIGFFINSLQPAWAAPKESNVNSPKANTFYGGLASGGNAYLIEYDTYFDKIYVKAKRKLD